MSFDLRAVVVRWVTLVTVAGSVAIAVGCVVAIMARTAKADLMISLKEAPDIDRGDNCEHRLKAKSHKRTRTAIRLPVSSLHQVEPFDLV